MTSMLLTERRGPAGSRRELDGSPGPPRRSFLGTVTRRDPLLFGVGGRRLLDHGPNDGLIRLDPIRDQLPFRSVPLLKLDGAAPLVVQTGNLDRLQQAGGSQLFQT